MDPIQIYTYLTTARARLFDALRPLPDADYRREFPFALKRISATLPHMLNAEWNYAWRIERGERPDQARKPIAPDSEPSFAAMEAAWCSQAETTRRAIESSRSAGRWDTMVETRTPFDGKVMIVRASPADVFMQLLCHEVHHRAQVMAMLKAMGVVVQDLDYSTMSYITWE
jgi:uncharacterized damage-inducible protein DinB